jgi:hypothetical protein
MYMLNKVLIYFRNARGLDKVQVMFYGAARRELSE